MGPQNQYALLYCGYDCIVNAHDFVYDQDHVVVHVHDFVYDYDYDHEVVYAYEHDHEVVHVDVTRARARFHLRLRLRPRPYNPSINPATMSYRLNAGMKYTPCTLGRISRRISAAMAVPSARALVPAWAMRCTR
jgi:hypothetical protein